MGLLPAHLCVVLVEPTQPENVGAVARVMANLGVTNLRLVNPCDHRSRPARRLATHAQEVLERATVHDSLAAAIADQHLILGTTARHRDRHARITPLPQIRRLLPRQECQVAVVFGRESSGLTNAELALCNGWVRIPTFGANRSLNLAQAAGITLYELSRRYSPSPHAPVPVHDPLATSRDIEGLKQHLFAVLKEVRFLKPNQEATSWSSFSDGIGRARLTELDVRLLRGFLHKLELAVRRMESRETSPRKRPRKTA